MLWIQVIANSNTQTNPNKHSAKIISFHFPSLGICCLCYVRFEDSVHKTPTLTEETMNISILSVLDLILRVQTSNTNLSGPSNRRYSPSCCLVILQKCTLPYYQLVYIELKFKFQLNIQIWHSQQNWSPPGMVGYRLEAMAVNKTKKSEILSTWSWDGRWDVEYQFCPT